jgi:hypothetical protein
VHKLGNASAALVSACTAIATLHTKAVGLAAHRPTRMQIDVMVGRVIATALMRAGVQAQAGSSFLAPDERRDADALLQYGNVIRADASSRLGEQKEAA